MQILIVAPGERGADVVERALAHAEQEQRLPQEIHVVAAEPVIGRLQRELLQGGRSTSRFSTLCSRLGIARDEILFNQRTFHAIDADDYPVRSCASAVNHTVRLLRQLCANDRAVTILIARDAALHGVLLHGALQVVGRPGDRVLVESLQAAARQRRAGRASYSLQPLEVPLLLSVDPDQNPGEYTHLVQRRQVERRRLVHPDVLTIDCRRRAIAVGETAVKLPAMQFFWMYYLASASGERFPLAELSTLLAEGRRQGVQLTQKLTDGRVRVLPSDLQRAFARLFPLGVDKFDAMLMRSCGPHPGLPSTISKINTCLKRALGRGAEPYLIDGGRGSGGYRLHLAPERVEILNNPDSRRG